MIKLTSDLVESRNALGIVTGQIRAEDYVHNGGWYNGRGEKIGWGDLSPADFKRIRDQLAMSPGEMFIVLGERDSFWNFVKMRRGDNGEIYGSVDDIEGEPGIDYIVFNARWLISSSGVFHFYESDKTWNIGECEAAPMSRERLKQLLLVGQ